MRTIALIYLLMFGALLALGMPVVAEAIDSETKKTSGTKITVDPIGTATLSEIATYKTPAPEVIKARKKHRTKTNLWEVDSRIPSKTRPEPKLPISILSLSASDTEMVSGMSAMAAAVF